MKQTIIALSIIAGLCWIGTGAEVKHEHKKWNYQRTVNNVDYFTVSNDKTSYKLMFNLSNEPEKAPAYCIAMMEPGWNSNFRNGGFLDISVNGIPIRRLEPLSLEKWSKNNEAGVIAVFNFDGIRVKIKFFLKDGSPVMWGNLEIDSSGGDAVSSLVVTFNSTPGNPQKFDDGKFHRFVVTPERTLPAGEWKEVSLNNNEFYVLMADEKYDFASNSKSAGPSFILFEQGDKASITVKWGNHYAVVIDAKLSPNIKSYNFGLWENGQPLSNNAALEMLKNNAKEYQKSLNK